MIEAVEPTLGHVRIIAAGMRPIDRMECELQGEDPKTALWRCFHSSRLKATIKIDGKVVAMFGVAAVNEISGHGTPWFLGTEDAKGAMSFVKLGRKAKKFMESQYGRLENKVHKDNSTSIAWLRHIGFTVGTEPDEKGFLTFSNGGA